MQIPFCCPRSWCFLWGRFSTPPLQAARPRCASRPGFAGRLSYAIAPPTSHHTAQPGQARVASGRGADRVCPTISKPRETRATPVTSKEHACEQKDQDCGEEAAGCNKAINRGWEGAGRKPCRRGR